MLELGVAGASCFDLNAGSLSRSEAFESRHQRPSSGGHGAARCLQPRLFGPRLSSDFSAPGPPDVLGEFVDGCPSPGCSCRRTGNRSRLPTRSSEGENSRVSRLRPPRQQRCRRQWRRSAVAASNSVSQAWHRARRPQPAAPKSGVRLLEAVPESSSQRQLSPQPPAPSAARPRSRIWRCRRRGRVADSALPR